jgi:pimeloyl-ACP methyl ester carboxylesterase
MVVMIHGFNNDEGVARRRYATLHRALLACAARPGDSERLIDERSVWFFWPGDRYGVVGFRRNIGVAQDAARRLADYLISVRSSAGTRPQEIRVVAHSLGCRLLLELSLLLDQARSADRGAPQIRDTCLMAAAVPTALCEDGNIFGSRPEVSGPRPARIEQVLFSGRDKALLAFRFGGAEEGAGRLPHAVGRTGLPRRRWHYPVDTGLGHGDYYGHPKSAGEVTRLFDIVRSRSLPEHNIVRAEFEAGELLTRSIPDRRIGGLPAEE